MLSSGLISYAMSFNKGRAVVNLQQSGSKQIFGFVEKSHLWASFQVLNIKDK